jgi:regulator of sigma E protease
VIIFIGVLVFVHELGHFLVAKACGVKVLRFSFGFGPKLFGVERGETEYCVSALPLGGYVKMLGEMPGAEIPPEDAPRAFSARPLWQRILIVLAGPAANFALAWLVYFAVGLGMQTFGDTRLGIVSRGEPAWKAGVRPGDRIVKIDGAPIHSWDELRERISKRPGEKLRATLERDGQILQVEITPRAREEANLFREIETRGHIGISPHYVKTLVGIVDLDSPAARAGLKTGDVIEAVNGHPVVSWHELRARVKETPAGEPVHLRVHRQESSMSFDVRPGEYPEGVDRELFSAADTHAGYTGLVSQECLVAEVEPDTPAARIGLKPGDRLTRLVIENGQTRVERPIGVWGVDLKAFQGVDASSDFVLTFQRGRQIISQQLKLDELKEKDEFKNERTRFVFGAKNDEDTLGIYTFERFVGPLEAIRIAGQNVAMATTLIGKGIAKLVQREIPIETMGGPIMLFEIAAKSAERGLRDYLSMLAMISVNLGLLNLLPVPVLDGGHLMLFGIEAIRRRPPSLRFREVANLIGLALLLLLMVLVFRNDIVRLVFN